MTAPNHSPDENAEQTAPETETSESSESSSIDVKVGDDADTEEGLVQERDAAKKEAQENYDRLLRVSAEFENYKKRSARETAEFRKYANESLVRELLPVIDNLERALESSSDNETAEGSVIAGVSMTLNEILKIFERFNVTQINALEKPFDPTYHQAVVREETDAAPENTVVNVLQKGYLMHDRLIRPCMVAVATPATKPTETDTKEK